MKTYVVERIDNNLVERIDNNLKSNGGPTNRIYGEIVQAESKEAAAKQAWSGFDNHRVSVRRLGDAEVFHLVTDRADEATPDMRRSTMTLTVEKARR